MCLGNVDVYMCPTVLTTSGAALSVVKFVEIERECQMDKSIKQWRSF